MSEGIIVCPLCGDGKPDCSVCEGTGVAQCVNLRCSEAATTFDPATGDMYCAECRREQIALQMDDAA